MSFCEKIIIALLDHGVDTALNIVIGPYILLFKSYNLSASSSINQYEKNGSLGIKNIICTSYCNHKQSFSF